MVAEAGVGVQGEQGKAHRVFQNSESILCDALMSYKYIHMNQMYTPTNNKNETLVKTIHFTALRVNLNTCKLLKMNCKKSFRSLGESQDGLQNVTSVCLYYKR